MTVVLAELEELSAYKISSASDISPFLQPSKYLLLKTHISRRNDYIKSLTIFTYHLSLSDQNKSHALHILSSTPLDIHLIPQPFIRRPVISFWWCLAKIVVIFRSSYPLGGQGFLTFPQPPPRPLSLSQRLADDKDGYQVFKEENLGKFAWK
ncbi:hypothetical protein CDAR_49271 [Caerostris darwini]|uniref:Uncharacterized protein n=1 Tax=Caerostris darwini TaxID=1538125 RepID=A0AAV4QDV3_9ARAC|nr:hypothetical protein CDAR_49271 [Caerostris darwini]